MSEYEKYIIAYSLTNAFVDKINGNIHSATNTLVKLLDIIHSWQTDNSNNEVAYNHLQNIINEIDSLIEECRMKVGDKS